MGQMESSVVHKENGTNNRHYPPQPTKGSAIRLLLVISACVPFSYSINNQSSNYPHCAFHLPTLASRTCTNTEMPPCTIEGASIHLRLASSTELPVCHLGRPAKLERAPGPSSNNQPQPASVSPCRSRFCNRRQPSLLCNLSDLSSVTIPKTGAGREEPGTP